MFSKAVEPAASPEAPGLATILEELQALRQELRPAPAEPVSGQVWSELSDLLFQKLQYPLIRDLILYYDRLSKSIASLEAEPVLAGSAWSQTLRSLPEELVDLLRDHGVELVEVGLKLDPELHQACSVLATTDPASHQRISRVVRAGFRLNGKMLRKAEVEIYRLESPAGGAR